VAQKRQSEFCVFAKTLFSSGEAEWSEAMQEFDGKMKVCVRCASLDARGLKAAEDHGKRLDDSSKKRRIREAAPLVLAGLDLSSLYAEHVAGAKMNVATKKPVLHMIVRFPPELLDMQPNAEARRLMQHEMLQQAADWANSTHGGNAVFAARIDLDEEGETIVDLFLAPKYEKKTARKSETWVSTTKFGKDIARKHQDEIRLRFKQAKEGRLTSPRAVGIALNSDFRAFFESTFGFKLADKKLKVGTLPDRVSPEQLKEKRARALREQAEAAANDEWAEVHLAYSMAEEAWAETTQILAKAENEADLLKKKATETANAEASKILEKARSDADLLKEEATKTANAEASKILEKARNDADLAKEKATETAKAEKAKSDAKVDQIRLGVEEFENLCAQSEERHLEKERKLSEEQRELDNTLKTCTEIFNLMADVVRTWSKVLKLEVPQEQNTVEEIRRLLSAIQVDNSQRIAKEELTQISDRESDSLLLHV
jgi:hypothetical protein